MKLSRFQAIHNGLNGVAKRVYEAVPISAPWSTHKIMRELERKGSHMELKAIQGCLGYMLSVGIIERDKEGDFIRTQLKIANNRTPDEPVEVPSPTKEETTMATGPVKLTVTPAVPEANPTVFDMLDKLAKRVGDLSDMADALRQDIETVALHAQSDLDKNNAELAKLRQLKALLGSLND